MVKRIFSAQDPYCYLAGLILLFVGLGYWLSDASWLHAALVGFAAGTIPTQEIVSKSEPDPRAARILTGIYMGLWFGIYMVIISYSGSLWGSLLLYGGIFGGIMMIWPPRAEQTLIPPLPVEAISRARVWALPAVALVCGLVVSLLGGSDGWAIWVMIAILVLGVGGIVYERPPLISWKTMSWVLISICVVWSATCLMNGGAL